MPIFLRETPPQRLSVNAYTPSGSVYRWAEDEKDAANVPSGLSFSSTIPGGFEQLSCTLPRKPGIDYPDLERLTTLVVSGPGSTRWEGRLERAPRTSGDQMSVTPNAVGWQAHLEDDKSARMIYIDRDLGSWQTMSRAHRSAFIAASITPNDGQVDSDPTSGTPAISLSIPGNASTTRQAAEMLYDAGVGQSISKIAYEFVRGANVTSSYTAIVSTDDTDDFSADNPTSNLAASASSTSSLAGRAGDRFGLLQLVTPSGDGGTDGLLHDVTFRNMAVFGNHGLTVRTSSGFDGFYASDVVAHAVRTWAPLLNLTTGATGTVTDSSFVIPQLAFKDPTTAAGIISSANRYHLRDWAVWEDKTFYYHDRGARGNSWRARIAPSQLSETGPQVDRLYNGVVVRFQDVDGTSKTVGPPGSGCDTTSDLLEDDSSDNPVNELGIKRWAQLDIGGVAVPAAAAEAGWRFLYYANQFDTSGQAQLVGVVEDDKGILHAASEVLAGDTISFVDAADTSARRITKTSYDHASRTCTIDLDAPPDGLDALLQRWQVTLNPLGL